MPRLVGTWLLSGDDPHAAMAGEYEVDVLERGGWQIIGGFEDWADALEWFNRCCGHLFQNDPRNGTSGDFDYRLRHGERVLLHAKLRMTIKSG